MKHHGHSTFESVIDNRGMCSDENFISGTILSFDEVCVGSPVIVMLQKKLTNRYKEKLGILSSIRDHRKQKLGSKGGCLHLQIY